MFLSVVKAILFCVYASVCFCNSDGKIILSKNVSVSAVLVFGDSLVDQGNNNYINTLGKANYLPYGKDYQGGNPTGRFSNGKTLSDVFAEALGVKDYLPPSLDPFLKDEDLQTGVSFASGGSGFDPLTTTMTSGIPMSVQLDMFKEYIAKLKKNLGEEAVKNIVTNSVVVVAAGYNDLIFSLPIRRPQYDVQAYSNMLVKLILNFTQEIYALGVRRIVIISAPPLGCLPEIRTLAGGPLRRCAYNENNIAQSFNNILKQKLQSWEASFPQSRVALIDFYNPLINIIENPHKYGFDVIDRGCCGTGTLEVIYLCNKLTPTCPDDSKYFFWDGFHPSEKGNQVFVNLILQDLVTTLF